MTLSFCPFCPTSCPRSSLVKHLIDNHPRHDFTEQCGSVVLRHPFPRGSNTGQKVLIPTNDFKECIIFCWRTQVEESVLVLNFVLASVLEERQLDMYLGTNLEPRQIKMVLPCPLLPYTLQEKYPRQELLIPLHMINSSPTEDLEIELKLHNQ